MPFSPEDACSASICLVETLLVSAARLARCGSGCAPTFSSLGISAVFGTSSATARTDFRRLVAHHETAKERDNLTHLPFFHRSRHARCSARETNFWRRPARMTFPERGLVVAVMTNISFADTKSIALSIAQTFAEQGRSPARQ